MLDYSIPDFTFWVGGFDATDYLDSIALACPQYEPSQPLIWTGSFRVSLNLLARQRGLGDADFSHLDSPGVWRPGQQPVTLMVRGQAFPKLRIERYAYNPQTRMGEGSLTQILALVAGDRPAVELIKNTGLPIPLGNVVSAAIGEAFRRTSVSPGVSIGGIGGEIYGLGTTRDPVGDAQRLCGINWQWLSVDVGESVTTVAGTPGGMIFTRSLDECEVEPDISNIHFAASKVIVTGSRQVPDEAVAAAAVPTQNNRPKTLRTEEIQPFGKIFPDAGTNATPIVAERKIVVYQYVDDLSTSDLQAGLGIDASILSEIGRIQIGNQFTVPIPDDRNQPIQTITVRLQPFGKLFPDTGTSTSLVTAEVVIESELRKIRYAPAGVVFPDLGTNTSLILDRREDLTTRYVKRIVDKTPALPDIDPVTGQQRLYEARPELEARQVLPQYPLKNEAIRGEAIVSPAGWTPVRDAPLVLEMGFLPSKGHAEYLAGQIARREQRRRDAVQVTMPIPDEWFVAGCPLLATCEIGGDVFQIDAPILVMSGAEAKFSFNGGLVSRGGIALFSEIEDIAIGFRVEIEVVSQSTGLADTEVIVEIPLSLAQALVDASAISVDVALEGAADLADASLMSVEISVDAIMDSIYTPTVSLAVSPSSVVEGSDFVLLPDSIVYVDIASAHAIDLLTPSIVDVGVLVAPDVTAVTPLPNVSLTVSPSSILEGSLPNVSLTVTPSSVVEG